MSKYEWWMINYEMGIERWEMGVGKWALRIEEVWSMNDEVWNENWALRDGSWEMSAENWVSMKYEWWSMNDEKALSTGRWALWDEHCEMSTVRRKFNVMVSLSNPYTIVRQVFGRLRLTRIYINLKLLKCKKWGLL